MDDEERKESNNSKNIQFILNIFFSVLMGIISFLLVVITTQQWNRDALQDKTIDEVRNLVSQNKAEIMSAINTLKADITAVIVNNKNELNTSIEKQKNELAVSYEALRNQATVTQLEQSRRAGIINAFDQAANQTIPKMAERIIALEVSVRELTNTLDKFIRSAENNFQKKSIQ